MKKMSIKEMACFIKEKQPTPNELQSILVRDERKGVKDLIDKYIKSLDKEKEELIRLKKLLEYENNAYNKGYKLIAGVDEAGRGPLAGPVVAAAVILPRGFIIRGLDDSKKLSEKNREALYPCIMGNALGVGIGIVDAGVIDLINIHQASMVAMLNALQNLPVSPEYVLVDGFSIKSLSIPQQAINKGDSLSLSIGAASVIAKVTRDRLIRKYADEYWEYGLEEHKGYGTRNHIAAISKYGLSPLHRKSFCRNFQ